MIHRVIFTFILTACNKQVCCYKHVDQFDNPNLLGEMHVTITLNKVSCGTDLKIVQEGISEAIPIEMCYLGWQQSLNLLT